MDPGPEVLPSGGDRPPCAGRRPGPPPGGPSYRYHQPGRAATLRHAFITAAPGAGVPLRDVQEAASPAGSRTIMPYDSEGEPPQHPRWARNQYPPATTRHTPAAPTATTTTLARPAKPTMTAAAASRSTKSRPGQPAPLRATGGPPDRCRRWALCQARADDYELGGHGWPQPRVLAPRPAARSARTTNPPRPPPATSASGADPADRCQPLRRPVAAGSRCQADRLARRAGQMKASWPDEGAQEPQSKEKSVRIAAGPVSRASHPAWLGPSSLTLRYLAVPL